MVWMFQSETQGKSLSKESRLVYQQGLIEDKTIQGFLPEDVESLENLKEATLVTGSIPVMEHVFHRLGVESPAPNYYPSTLEPWLYRKIDVMKATEFMGLVLATEKPWFAKSIAWKRHTGMVYDPVTNWGELNLMDPGELLLVSDPVNWISEWRFYVVHGEVVGRGFASGDESIEPNQSVVEQALERLNRNEKTPCAYAIDWGVLDNGKTALIEMNDGWSIGAYDGVGAKEYTTMLEARFCEILRQQRVHYD